MSIKLASLVKEYKGADGKTVRAVDSVSLTIAEGELVTLLGPSGCGKTTTLRMIAGFEQPTSGEIWIGDRKLSDVPAHQRDTPMVFQSYALFPHLTVRDNAIFGLSMRKIGRAEASRRVEELARSMGLSDLLDRAPHQLSGGQQQRVALLRALVTEPRVLLFDEPLSNLDARLRVSMRAEIRRIQRRAGVTAVYVTHDQEEAMVLSDRIVVMENGRIAQVGAPRDVYARPASMFVATFLGEASFLDAKVIERQGPRLLVESVLGRCAIDDARDITNGRSVTLVVRPESLRLSREPSGMRARIRTVTDLGAQVLYELDLSGTILLVRALESIFREGEEVSVAAGAVSILD
jgi:iron(III) transport system ATP-binding protein